MAVGDRERGGVATEKRGGELRLENLSKRYLADAPAVNSASLNVAAGEFVTLLGPSGSGKSTTLGMIAGFIEPDAGDVFLDGQRITNVSPHRRGIGVVFQNYALFPLLTVFENLAFPLRVRRRPIDEIKARVGAALEMVGLAEYSERRPRELSGGQQQRVALARALVFDPPVVLMDEPLGALDKKLRERLQFEIKQIQSRLGLTLIHVTHDQEEALAMSDRIVVMNQGRIEQIGTPIELYRRPANAFVADFIGQSNFFEGVVTVANVRECNVSLRDGYNITVPVDEPWQAGAQGIVMVRPEKIELTPRDGGGNGKLAGVVEAVAFVGDSTKYTIKLDAGLTITARLQQSGVPYQQGDLVMVGWGPTSARLVRSQTTIQAEIQKT